MIDVYIRQPLCSILDHGAQHCAKRGTRKLVSAVKSYSALSGRVLCGRSQGSMFIACRAQHMHKPEATTLSL